MRARTIAIGDIHGCPLALDAVLRAIQPGPRDTIITLGDYIDRGPDSRGVVDRLLQLEKETRLIPLLGNHELMLLDVLRLVGENPPPANVPQNWPWLLCGGKETLSSYGGSLANIPPEHLTFFNRCVRWYETPTHLFIHANYSAELPLDDQPEYLLFWEHLRFSIPGPHNSGKTAIVGHTSQPTGEIFDLGHVVCIDTHCHGRGWLTALDVDDRTVWQADKTGALRQK